MESIFGQQFLCCADGATLNVIVAVNWRSKATIAACRPPALRALVTGGLAQFSRTHSLLTEACLKAKLKRDLSCYGV